MSLALTADGTPCACTPADSKPEGVEMCDDFCRDSKKRLVQREVRRDRHLPGAPRWRRKERPRVLPVRQEGQEGARGSAARLRALHVLHRDAPPRGGRRDAGEGEEDGAQAEDGLRSAAARAGDGPSAGICPAGYYQAVDDPNYWACGAGCAGGMYTRPCFCLPVSLGRPKPEERRVRRLVDGAGSEIGSKGPALRGDPADCPTPWLGDGYCDSICNNEACGFDEGDCEGTAPVDPANDYCAPGCPPNWPGDGICDSTCDVEECGFDSGDCDQSAPTEEGRATAPAVRLGARVHLPRHLPVRSLYVNDGTCDDMAPARSSRWRLRHRLRDCGPRCPPPPSPPAPPPPPSPPPSPAKPPLPPPWDKVDLVACPKGSARPRRCRPTPRRPSPATRRRCASTTTRSRSAGQEEGEEQVLLRQEMQQGGECFLDSKCAGCQAHCRDRADVDVVHEGMRVGNGAPPRRRSAARRVGVGEVGAHRNPCGKITPVHSRATAPPREHGSFCSGQAEPSDSRPLCASSIPGVPTNKCSRASPRSRSRSPRPPSSAARLGRRVAGGRAARAEVSGLALRGCSNCRCRRSAPTSSSAWRRTRPKSASPRAAIKWLASRSAARGSAAPAGSAGAGRRVGFVQSVCVAPDARRRGIASELVRWCELRCSEAWPDVGEIWLAVAEENDAARRCAELGYLPCTGRPASATGCCGSRWPCRRGRPAQRGRADGARRADAPPPPPPPPPPEGGSGWRRWRPTSACSASMCRRIARRRGDARSVWRAAAPRAPRPLAYDRVARRRRHAVGGGARGRGAARALGGGGRAVADWGAPGGRAAVGRRRRPRPRVRRRRRCDAPALRDRRRRVGRGRRAGRRRRVAARDRARRRVYYRGFLQSAGRLALTALPPGSPPPCSRGCARRRRRRLRPGAHRVCRRRRRRRRRQQAAVVCDHGRVRRRVRLALRGHRPPADRPRRGARRAQPRALRATGGGCGSRRRRSWRGCSGTRYSRYEPLRGAGELAPRSSRRKPNSSAHAAMHASLAQAAKRTPPKKKAPPTAATTAPITLPSPALEASLTHRRRRRSESGRRPRAPRRRATELLEFSVSVRNLQHGSGPCNRWRC